MASSSRLRVAAVLAAVVLLAAAPRLWRLGTYGFSADEINKWRAVDSYNRGDFSANAEHPMLMKLAMWASVGMSGWWNAQPALAGIATISPEAALRLPNALVGAATTVVIFLLARLLFDTAAGLWAAFFWAVDVNATAINRIGKEDTFLLFFLLLAAVLFECAKRMPAWSRAIADRWYAWSGASFGLMLASKYLLHYVGIHALFNIVADGRTDDPTPDKGRPFYVAMGVAFLAANINVVFPQTWRYLAGYVHGDTLVHTGYDFAGRIYVNTIGVSPAGVPVTFYPVFFLTKIPIVVLAAIACGLVWSWRHRRERGAVFIRVFLLFTVLPYSLIAGKFLRYMLPVLAVLDITAALGVVALLRRTTRLAPRWQTLAAAAIITPVIVAPLTQQVSAAPFYSLSMNSVAARLLPAGSLFPDDEFYDGGTREAVQKIAANALPGAVICSETPDVVDEYLRRSGRLDVHACAIARDGLPMRTSETWVLVQQGHRYFENSATLDLVRAHERPWLDVPFGGVSAVQVYRLSSDHP